ncbi:MAG: hypothetical protein PHG16_10555 [Lachnospiraceae bacterium]|nr:hypothetical protein [Lachnospiraceae bacterium]
MLFLYDLKNGWRRNRVRFAVACVLLLFLGGMSYRACAFGSWKISLWDMLIWAFLGEPPYVMAKENIFRFPTVIFLFQLYLFFCLGSYPLQNLAREGQKYMLLCRSRSKWWLSKCLWVAVSVLCYYMLFVGLLFLIRLLFGTQGNAQVSLTEFPQYSAAFTTPELLLNVLLLPLMMSIALSLLQLFISIMLSLQLAYLANILLLGISVYWFTPFMPGNYLMLLRNRLVTPDGVTFWQGCVTAAVISIFSIAIGLHHMKTHDILSGRTL